MLGQPFSVLMAAIDVSGCHASSPPIPQRSVVTSRRYVYIPASEASDVANLIGSLAAGDVDVIAFTSAPQVERLSEVAQAYGLVDQLEQGLDRTHIAAIGPVVAGKLEELGAPPDTIASEPYSLKPLVKAIIFAIANDRP